MHWFFLYKIYNKIKWVLNMIPRSLILNRLRMMLVEVRYSIFKVYFIEEFVV